MVEDKHFYMLIGLALGLSMGLNFGSVQARRNIKNQSELKPVIAYLNKDKRPDYVIEESEKRIILLSQPDGSYKTLEQIEKETIEITQKEAISNLRATIEAKLKE